MGYLGQGNSKSAFGGIILHEIVHLMKHDEFEGYSAELAAGYSSIQDYIIDVGSEGLYLVDYITDRSKLPTEYSNYVDKSHKLLDLSGLEALMKNIGNSIIGNK